MADVRLSQIAIRRMAKGVNAYAFRLAEVAERLNKLADRTEDADDTVEFCAHLAPVSLLAHVVVPRIDAIIRHALRTYDEDAEQIEKFNDLASMLGDADIQSVLEAFGEGGGK